MQARTKPKLQGDVVRCLLPLPKPPPEDSVPGALRGAAESTSARPCRSRMCPRHHAGHHHDIQDLLVGLLQGLGGARHEQPPGTWTAAASDAAAASSPAAASHLALQDLRASWGLGTLGFQGETRRNHLPKATTRLGPAAAFAFNSKSESETRRNQLEGKPSVPTTTNQSMPRMTKYIR